jgi:hypothetical protein
MKMNSGKDAACYVFSPRLLNSLQLSHRALVDEVACIQRGSRLKQEKPAFLVRNRTVLHSARHNDEFTFLDPFMPVEEFHAEPPLYNQEHLVFVLVVMEDELPLQFIKLHMLAVELGSDVGLPVFRNLSELFGDIDLIHGMTLYVSVAFLGSLRVELIAKINPADPADGLKTAFQAHWPRTQI